MGQKWDYIIVGSGFGGSVSALRLVEKGYRVLLLEQGHRYRPEDFAKSTWNLRRWFWLPWLGLRGPFRMTFLRHVTALSGVGVGGGSLVYAGVLQEPRDDFFTASSWAHLSDDWHAELEPHYRTALRMIGGARVPFDSYPDTIMRDVATALGRAERHAPTTVGVFFGDGNGNPGDPAAPPQPVPDPFFGGEGPERSPCIHCGGCMVGCRHGAKNTLDRNYLWLAERKGLEIRAESQVTALRRTADGYRVEVKEGRRPWPRRRRVHEAANVVLSAGVLGTVPLLLRMRDDPDGLPDLSPRVGHFVRTNSEVLMGVVAPGKEMSEGVAITSILQSGEHSSLEPVRYPAGSGALRILQAPHAPGDTLAQRLGAAARRVLRHPLRTLRTWFVRDWGRHTLILLYMSTDDSHLRLLRGGATGRLLTRVTRGSAPRASIPEATELGDKVAELTGGYPVSFVMEMLSGTPTTAHILGGSVMGAGPDHGVIGTDHQVWNYPGLFVIDGSAVSANPGVNPSLTITALAERAMSQVPEKADVHADALPVRSPR